MSLLSKSSRFIGRGGVCRRIIGEKSWVPFSQDHLQCSTFHQKRWLCSNLGEEKNESNSSTSELKERLKNRIEERKLSKWKPGQKLTNAEILSLFRSYSERNSSQDAEGVKKAFQHPILHVYGFDRKEFIQGVKQALSMISESVSSPRFRAFCKGYCIINLTFSFIIF